MAKDNLLKDAIADAKAVKEAAIANAMLTLKESFKPQLTSMLAAKLRNEEETFGENEEEKMEEQNTLKSSEIGSGGKNTDDPGPKEPSKAASDSSDIEDKGLEELPMGKGSPKVAPIKEDLPPEGGEGEFGGDSAGQFGMDNGQGDEHGDEEMNDDGLDLEAIIRELEADLLGKGDEGGMGGDEMGGEENGEVHESEPFGHGDPHVRPEYETFTQAHGGQDVNGGIKVETVPGKSGDGEEHDGKAAPAKDGVNGGKEVKPGAAQTGDELGSKDFTKAKGSVDEEVDLDEILREMEAESVNENSDHIANENVELKRSLHEHREVIKLLRSRINEVTLLNSKLMFTTKIFRKFNLSEDQKKKVVEQLDRASTLREAKIVFTTLAETITNRMGSASLRKTAAKITEGASRQIGNTKPKSQTILSEGSEQVARLQKLAGIKLNTKLIV